MSSEEVDSDEMDELYAQADQSFAFLMELVKGANAEAASAVWTTMHEYANAKVIIILKLYSFLTIFRGNIIIAYRIY